MAHSRTDRQNPQTGGPPPPDDAHSHLLWPREGRVQSGMMRTVGLERGGESRRVIFFFSCVSRTSRVWGAWQRLMSACDIYTRVEEGVPRSLLLPAFSYPFLPCHFPLERIGHRNTTCSRFHSSFFHRIFIVHYGTHDMIMARQAGRQMEKKSINYKNCTW